MPTALIPQDSTILRNSRVWRMSGLILILHVIGIGMFRTNVVKIFESKYRIKKRQHLGQFQADQEGQLPCLLELKNALGIPY